MNKRILYALTVLLFAWTGTTFMACNCDDLNSSDTNWANNPAAPSLTGIVTTTGGKVLANATITLTLPTGAVTVTTDAEGRYTLNNLTEGTYSIQASYPKDSSYITKSDNVTLTNNTVTQWDAILYPPNTQATVTENEEGKIYQITLPDIVAQDDETTTQIATYVVPANSLEKENDLVLSTWYDLSTSSTRAYSYSGRDVVIIAESKAKSGATTTKKDITIRVNGLIKPSKVIHNGHEITDFKEEEGGDVVSTYFKTKELGRTEFYYPIEISDVTAKSVDITYNPSSFTGYTDVINTTYTYHYGREIGYNHSFLDQYVMLMEGTSRTIQEYTSTFTTMWKVPVGEKVFLYGTQPYYEYSYRCNWSIIPVKRYGNITFGFKDRMHTGGSN